MPARWAGCKFHGPARIGCIEMLAGIKDCTLPCQLQRHIKLMEACEHCERSSPVDQFSGFWLTGFPVDCFSGFPGVQCLRACEKRNAG